jgi:hypothetical protein
VYISTPNKRALSLERLFAMNPVQTIKLRHLQSSSLRVVIECLL